MILPPMPTPLWRPLTGTELQYEPLFDFRDGPLISVFSTLSLDPKEEQDYDRISDKSEFRSQSMPDTLMAERSGQSDLVPGSP
jgi:hypothetical protein